MSNGNQPTSRNIWTIIAIIVLVGSVFGLTLLADDNEQQELHTTTNQTVDTPDQTTETTQNPVNENQPTDQPQLATDRLGAICNQTFSIVENETQLQFDVVDDYALMSGPLDTDVPDLVNQLITNNPDVTTIVMTYVPGSDDDDANAEAIRAVYDAEFDICLPDNAEIASGGVDFFLAGRQRDIGDNAYVGVHSWADDANVEGGDLPRNDPQHQVYLDLFAYINVDPDFYWFTLDAASADTIHNMTQAERDRFNLDNYVQ